MAYIVWVDRNALAEFADEFAALSFVRHQFQDEVVAREVWIESGDDVIRGPDLVNRIRSIKPNSRLSA